MSTNFKTSDIVLAACLQVHNYKLTDIEVFGSKGTFVFADVDDDIVHQYDTGQCRVEPQNFNSTIKQLTTAIKRKANEQTI